MGSVHFVGGEKGGVGKSFTARLLAQYLIDKGRPFIGFDTDASHATFTRFYGEFTSPVDINRDSSLDRIIEACVDYPDHDLIIDLAAQSYRRLDQWIEEGDIFSLFCEVGIPVYFWHVMDDGADANSLLDKLLDRYPQADLNFVVVQNYGRGSSFDGYQQSNTRRKAEQRNSHVLVIDKLQTELTQKIDFGNISFWAAANNSEQMSIIERQRVRVWLKNCYQRLDQLFGDQACEQQAAEELPVVEPDSATEVQ